MSLRASLSGLDEKGNAWFARIRSLAPAALALALTAYVLRGMLDRLTLSVDLTDEAFSTALAYRFALGARPFVDEINSAQTAGMLLAPFVWLYVKVTHSSAGIMLFTRLLFLAFRTGVAAGIFTTLRRHVSWPLALAASLAAIVFVPFSIPNLGYNVLGSGFFVLGGFLAARALDGDVARRGTLFWAGLCNGLATVAYPPLGLPAVLLGLILLFSTKAKLRDFVVYAAGGALVALWVTPFLVSAGGKHIRASLELGDKLTPRPISKFFDIALGLYAHSPINLWVVPAIAVSIGALKMRPGWAGWLLPTVVAALALGIPAGPSSQMSFEIYAGLFAPIFLVVLWDTAFCRTLFKVVWVPSFVAGFLTAYSSSNGEPNAALGLFPAAILFVVWEVMAVERLAREADTRGALSSAAASLAIAGPAILALSMLSRFANTVYRDGAVQDLTELVPSGPFRGLYTTPEHARGVEELEELLARHENAPGDLLAYWDIPAAYLFTRKKPASNSIWISQMADPARAFDDYRAHLDGRGLALKYRVSGAGGTPFDTLLEQRGHVVEATPRFVLTSEPGP